MIALVVLAYLAGWGAPVCAPDPLSGPGSRFCIDPLGGSTFEGPNLL